jgi:tetratricopeptide (TPR) repeat protein
LLGSHPSLIDLRSRLIARAAGNPFFLEETIKGLIEADLLSGQPGAYRARTAVHAFKVPPTVHAVLQARIDRLPQPERQVLEHAALLGLEFRAALLEAMTGLPVDECHRRLAKLQAADLLYEVRPAAPIYSFTHALVAEVAYAGVPEARRKDLHDRAMVAFETVARGRINDYAEVMAQHATLAERRDKAVDYSRAAAAKAWARGALAEAVLFGERALEMSRELPGSRENTARRIDARLDLHAPLFAAGQIARLVELHGEAERMARETNDRRRIGAAAFRLAAYCSLNAQYEAGIRYADEALEIASDLEDRDLRVVALYMLTQIYGFCGNHPAMARCGERIVDGADAERAQERLGMSIAPYVMACGQLAHSFALRGEFGRALAYVDRAGAAADRTGHAPARVWAAISRTDVLVHRGDYSDARPAAELAVALTQEHQLMMWLPTSYVVRGRALVGTGEVSEGLAMVQQGVAMHESLGVKAGQADFLVSLGESLVSAGRYEEATRAAEAARAVAAMVGQRTTEAQAGCVRAEAQLGQGDPRACQDSLNLIGPAVAMASHVDLHPFVARLELVRARALHGIGDVDGGRAAAETALGRFMAMGMRSYVEQTRQYFPDLKVAR